MSKTSITPAYECASHAIQNEARARIREAAQRQRGHTLPPSLPPPSLPPGDIPTTTSTAAGADPVKLLKGLNEKEKKFEAERLAHQKHISKLETLADRFMKDGNSEGLADTLNKLDKANELTRKYSRPK